MKKIISVLLVMTVAILTFVPSAFAADLASGAKIFASVRDVPVKV